MRLWQVFAACVLGNQAASLGCLLAGAHHVPFWWAFAGSVYVSAATERGMRARAPDDEVSR